MTLGSIIVRLTMQTADFETDAGRAAKVAQKRAQEIDAAFRKAGAAIGVALGAAVVGATGAIKRAVDRMDELSKASQRVGMPTEDFSRLAYAGDLADVSMETLVSSLGKLTKSQSAALNTTSEQARVFGALGIAVTDTEGKLRSSNDVLLDFADRFKAMEGSPEAMAAGFSLFGRSFQDLIPLLKDGSAGLREAAAESDALGKTLSTEAGRAAENFNDNLTRLQSAVGGAWMEIAQGMLPNLNRMTGELVSASKETNHLRELGEGITTVLGAVGNTFAFVAGMARQFGIDMGTAIEAASGWAEITKNIASFGIADGSISGGFGKIKNAGKTRAELIADEQRKRASAAAAADIDRLMANGTGAYNGPLLAPSNFEQDAAKAARAQQAALRKALGGQPGRSRGAGRGGKSEAQKAAEEAARAAQQLQDRYDGLITSQKEQIALFGDTSEAAKVRYATEFGDLSKLADAQKALLIANAQKLDTMREEADVQRDLDSANARREEVQKQLLDDIAYERDTIGMTNDQLEIYNRLKWAGVDANSAFGQSIAVQLQDLQAARDAMAQQIDGADAVRDSFKGLFHDLREGMKPIDALKNALDSLADKLFEIALNGISDSLFGKQGSPAGGSFGGLLSSLLGGLFGGKGFASGGFTGFGGAMEPAGIVHKGEVVWSQGDVARAGGVTAVEDMRRGGARGGSTVNQTFVVNGTPDRMTRQQMLRMAGAETSRAIRRG